jgi:hypothetical protein
MTTRLATFAAGGVRASSAGVAVAAGAVAFAALVVLRLRAMHPGLLYPDGYQYLLMARGIGEHLQAVTTLGHGGDTLAPSADAAAKPLFPALVALGESVGLSPLGAARLVTALAGAAVAPLAGLVTLRLGASRAAALLAGVLCLASPTLGFWLGFPGPEGLALALALAATLAFLSRHPIAGGMLAGLCVTSRPELVALALAASLAASASPRSRRHAMLGSTAGLATIAVVIGLIRPPLSVQTLVLLPAAVGLGCVAAVALVVARRASPRACIGVSISVAAVLVLALAHGSAWHSLARRDWPLLALAGAGLVVAARRAESRTAALRIATLALVLALAYWWKNPGSERYAAMLLPALAVLAGLGLGRLRPAVLTGAAVLALTGAVLASTPDVGPDSFHRHRGEARARPLGRTRHGSAGRLRRAAARAGCARDATGRNRPGTRRRCGACLRAAAAGQRPARRKDCRGRRLPPARRASRRRTGAALPRHGQDATVTPIRAAQPLQANSQ